MKTAEQLRAALRAIDHRSYPAYKSLAGSWSFGKYVLNIEHVQGDPFAAPSQLSVAVDARTAGFPASCWETPWNRTAMEDYLLRRFARQAGRFSRQAKGSGRSGVLAVTVPGQEALERTDCQVRVGAVTLRFEVGFPANGRTINAPELEKILFDFIPVCVEQGLLYANTPKGEVAQVMDLAEDRHFIREELARLELAAFVADGSVLPRESGVSDRPMKDAVPFQAPESMAVTLDLPHRGPVRGMGVRRGITLIAGGGYHGKSTLLKALERGVYDHIAGDGREYVITDHTAVKIRAEDGRKVTDTDISLFINHLPSGRDTTRFSTLDASGSTSQAANIAEALETGSRVLLMDEDTSATNFMVRDELMQAVIARDQEPITPFLERALDLWQKAGVSLILVVGSCGAYFHIADTVVQMDAYHARDITGQAKAALEGRPVPALSAPGFHLPTGGAGGGPVRGQPDAEKLPGGRLSPGAAEGEVLWQDRIHRGRPGAGPALCGADRGRRPDPGAGLYGALRPGTPGGRSRGGRGGGAGEAHRGEGPGGGVRRRGGPRRADHAPDAGDLRLL